MVLAPLVSMVQGVLIADRHIELVCTYGGSDIYQPLGVIKCEHIVNSEYPDLTNFEKIIAIITANLDSITSQVIAHSHSGERHIFKYWSWCR